MITRRQFDRSITTLVEWNWPERYTDETPRIAGGGAISRLLAGAPLMA